jgi:flagellar biosynthesis/type III secretory pathway M-ring protein FliF/YscJ
MSQEHAIVYLGTLALFIIGALSIILMFLLLFLILLPFIRTWERRRKAASTTEAAEESRSWSQTPLKQTPPGDDDLVPEHPADGTAAPGHTPPPRHLRSHGRRSTVVDSRISNVPGRSPRKPYQPLG